MLLYYITDRAQFPGTERKSRERLLNKIAEAASAGVDYVQLREKDLPARELESLAQQAAQIIRDSGSSTRLLINSRTDIALAAEAHGVHLTSNNISPVDARPTCLLTSRNASSSESGSTRSVTSWKTAITCRETGYLKCIISRVV